MQRSKQPVKQIKLSHGQSIKQSIKFNSAEASFSAELVVPYTNKGVRRGFRKLVTIVEEGLARKVEQQREFLHQIASK